MLRTYRRSTTPQPYGMRVSVEFHRHRRGAPYFSRSPDPTRADPDHPPPSFLTIRSMGSPNRSRIRGWVGRAIPSAACARREASSTCAALRTGSIASSATGARLYWPTHREHGSFRAPLTSTWRGLRSCCRVVMTCTSRTAGKWNPTACCPQREYGSLTVVASPDRSQPAHLFPLCDASPVPRRRVAIARRTCTLDCTLHTDPTVVDAPRRTAAGHAGSHRSGVLAHRRRRPLTRGALQVFAVMMRNGGVARPRVAAGRGPAPQRHHRRTTMAKYCCSALPRRPAAVNDVPMDRWTPPRSTPTSSTCPTSGAAERPASSSRACARPPGCGCATTAKVPAGDEGRSPRPRPIAAGL